MALEADTERLHREGEALSAHTTWLNQANSDLDTGCSTATSGCGHVADGGLASALSHLKDAWHYDIGSIAKDVGSIGKVLDSLAQMYGSVDQDGASALE